MHNSTVKKLNPNEFVRIVIRRLWLLPAQKIKTNLLQLIHSSNYNDLRQNNLKWLTTISIYM